MKLYLAQHGEAYVKEDHPERPLTDGGKQDIERLAAFLHQAGIQVDRLIHSGKLRAAQTAEMLASAIAPRVEIETSGLINPNDNPKAFDWQNESWIRDTLIVGHLPFMAKLVSHLVIEDDTTLITAFQPGSIVCLEHNNDGHWQINWMIRPEILKYSNNI
jgi:phosphohistidine phosphatase